MQYRAQREVVLVAVARGCELGVDLEVVRPDLPLDDVAAAFFTASEVQRLRALPFHQVSLATTLLWSAKEALLKATGTGIVGGLQTPLLSGLVMSPLLHGAPALGVQNPETTGMHLYHGRVGPNHLVMAAAHIRS